MICRKCFNDMPDFARFCPECGESIFSEDDRVCRFCSGILRKDDNFCMRCGRSREDALDPDNAETVSFRSEETYECINGKKYFYSSSLDSGRTYFWITSELYDAETNELVFKTTKDAVLSKDESFYTDWINSRNYIPGTFDYSLGSITAFGRPYFLIYRYVQERIDGVVTGVRQAYGLIDENGNTVIPISPDNIFITGSDSYSFDDHKPLEGETKWIPENTFRICCPYNIQKIVDIHGNVIAEGKVDIDDDGRLINEIMDKNMLRNGKKGK